MTPKRAVHRLRHPDRETAHAALETRRLVRLHQQVQMVRLDTEVQDAEPIAARFRQRASRGDEEVSAPEGGHGGAGAQRHVDWTMAIVGDATAMGDRTTSRRSLATGALASSTPAPNRKLELLHRARHLNWADIYHKLASLSSYGSVEPRAGQWTRG
jgi:hypothetical protein